MLMGQPLKKESDQPAGWPVTITTVREASRKVSQTIEHLTDKISQEIGEEVVSKEEADKNISHE